MATEVIMPRQGQSVESCLLLSWKKKEGEAVKQDEVLCEVETDKATFEVAAPADGILLKRLFAEGAEVPVLARLAWLGAAGEKLPDEASAPPSAPRGAPAPKPAPASPAASLAQPEPAEAAGRVFASPRARQVAAEKGLALAGLRGSGPGGRIMERDLPAADAARPAPAAPTRSSAQAAGAYSDLPVKGVRKLVAERMLASLAGHAQLTLNASADARRLLELRRRFKESPEQLGLRGVTINDMVMYAAAKVLPRHPELNAHFLGETIRLFKAVDLGFAVDTPRGLLVPVIRGAAELSLKGLSAEAGRLAAACAEGRVGPAELAGGSFTVTNLGSLGVESFTPVLNSPQAAILGVCAITLKPVQAQEKVEFVPQLGLSLTFDHQAVDGAPAARFLKDLREAVAAFDLLLAE